MNKMFLIAGLSVGILMGGTGSWADSPAPQATVAVKKVDKAMKSHSAKKTQKKAVVKAVWVCPMGDYSGPKTKDGKCPKCGMYLVKVHKKAEESDKKK